MNYQETRLKILQETFPDGIFNSKKKEYITFCPKHLHHKRKLEINIENNRFHCWVCNYGGFILKLLNENFNKNQIKNYLSTISDTFIKEQDIESTQVEFPEEYSFIFDNIKNPLFNAAYNWCKNLGLSDEVIFWNKIGFCTTGQYKNRMIFPSFDINGKLNFFETRHLFEQGQWKYLHCSGVPLKNFVFNEILINWNKPIVITESIKTYLKFFDLQNIIPVFGKTLNERFLLFEKIVLNNCPEVIIFLDSKTENETIDVFNKFIEYGINCKMVLNHSKNPDDMIEDDFLYHIQNSNILNTFDCIQQKLSGMIQ